MKHLKLVLFAGLLAGVSVGATNINQSAQGNDGKSIFVASKCQNCHSITSQGINRLAEPKAGEKVPSDLSSVGLRHKADWISKWLQKEEELEGKKHIKKFKGSDDDLETLSNWLGSLKAKSK